jgi:hypothetical protein
MNRFAFVFLLLAAPAAWAQTPLQPQPPRPTAEELAFARLPADVRGMLSGLTPAQGVQAVGQANQHLIALGIPNPTPEQFRGTLRNLLGATSYGSPSSSFSSVGSASAGATSFPPLSPLVAPPPPPLPQR